MWEIKKCPMNFIEMVQAFLCERGYEGLCNPELYCGCSTEEFPCCEYPTKDCVPAMKKTILTEDEALEYEGEFEVGQDIFVPAEPKPRPASPAVDRLVEAAKDCLKAFDMSKWPGLREELARNIKAVEEEHHA